VYQSTIDNTVHGSIRHQLADWLVDQFWPDILLDMGTIAAFGYASWVLPTVFAKVT
jgi:hypothetical protein